MTKIIDLLNSSPFNFYFLNIDPFLNLEIPELKNFYSLSPEKLNITLTEKNSGRFLSHPETIKHITSHTVSTGRTPAIIPFKPSARIEKICREQKWSLIAPNASQNRLLEDKIKFPQLLQHQSLPQIPHQVHPLSQTGFESVASEFGTPLVVQTHFGWAGNSSYLVSRLSELPLAPGTVVKYSPYLQGYSLLNNAVVFNRQLIQSPPGLQFTGIKPLTSNPLATVGRQWPAPITQNISDQIFNLTQQFFATILQPMNYRGYFGLDFFVSGHQVFILECNPRLTASFSFYYQLEKQIPDINPLLLLHLAEFLDIKTTEPDHFGLRLTGSELTRKNKQGATVAKKNFATALAANPNSVTIDSQIIDSLC